MSVSIAQSQTKNRNLYFSRIRLGSLKTLEI